MGAAYDGGMKMVVMFLLAAMLPAAAAPEPAENGARSVQAFLAAYNAKDEPRLEEFARTHFDTRTLADQPPAALARRYLARREETGPLTYAGVAMESPQHSEFLAQGAGRRWYQISLEGSPEAPHYADLTIDPTLSPPKSVATPKTRAAFVRAVDAYVDQLAQAGEFSGTVLVAKNGQPVYRRAAGFASREFGVPNKMDTAFNIGSIGKVFTQVAVLQLMQSGRIKPDDTIGRWLPDYPNAEARSATVAQLLSMQSGIGDFFGPEFAAAPHGRIRTLEDYLPFFAAKPLAFKPGTSQMYSNGGYLVLGLIVQKASGESYYDYVRDRIFVPAGMVHTGYPQVDDGTPGRAAGYTQTPMGLRNAIYGAPARGSSAGGAYSTAADLTKFAQALRSNRFLDAVYTRWLLERFPGNGPQSQTSAGVPGGMFGVAGGTPGANALLLSDASGSTIVVLSNLDPPAAEALGRQIRRWSVESGL